jgi:hypothetical protein
VNEPRTLLRKGRHVLTVVVSLTALVPAGGGLALAGQSQPAGAQTAAKSGLGFTVNSAVGTAQGLALTAPMPGRAGDYARVHALGMVGVSAQDGRTLWQRSADSLYADWHVTFPTLLTTVAPAPQVPAVTDPLSPAVPQLTGAAGTEGAANVHPVATGYLTGSRVPVVAVAETAGVQLGSGNVSPFHVPGSGLHEGTFVTVLNGHTGQTMYSQLDPGYVTQLAITGGRLVLADETGYPLSPLLPMGEWRSVTTVRALSFTPDGGGLTASTAWSYSTKAPWAAVFGLQPVGQDLAFTWSDTPEALGVPGPPEGHAVMVDPAGRVLWDVGTSGYPVLTGYDSLHRMLVVAEQADPTMRIGYTLAGLRPADGSVAVSVPVPGVLPTALTVSAGTWYAGGIVTTVRQIGNGVFTAGQVSAVDPAHQRARRVVWSADLTHHRGDEPYPQTLLAAGTWWPGQAIVVGSDLGAQLPSPAQPTPASADLRVLSGSTGQTLWQQSGGVAGPGSLALTGAPWAPQVVGVNSNQDALSYNLRTGEVLDTTPLLGDVTTALPARVDGHRVVIAGSQSGGVFALDASDLSRVVWQSYAGAPVHQVTLAGTAPCGAPALVVAATNRVDVIDLNTGWVRLTRYFSGQFVWNATAGTIGHDWSAVVVATDRLTAFDACTGRLLWVYRPPVPAYFSNAAIVDGTTVAQYQNKPQGPIPPTTMAAVGVGPDGKAAWTTPATPATTSNAVLFNGVFASPEIPGAGATGVAVAWQDGGSGRVDVRDALTGALVYSDSNGNLDGLGGWALDPRFGLEAITASGSVLLQPGHTVADQMRGSTAAFVTAAGHTDLIVGATALLQAFPSADLGSGGTTMDADDTTYAAGTVVPVGGPSTGQVISMPTDNIVAAVVQGAELGRPGGLSVAAPVVNGLTVQTLTGTSAAAAQPKPATSRRPTARPATAGVTSPRLGVGLATPQLKVKVRGYTRAGRPVLADAAPTGYAPALIGKYLHLTGDGAGQTVAVVDAFADPDITADVNTFSGHYGLPRVCGTAGAGTGCFRFTISAPHGTEGSNPGWALETSLDVEWIHAIAPKAAVRLVEARNDTFARLFDAVRSAAALHPDVVSISWGSSHEFSGEGYYDGACALTDSVCVVASGDDGYPGAYPAFDPGVIAVGGTTLQLTGAGHVFQERDWNDSGGGQSFFEPKPAAQQGVTPGSLRGVPDVSFDADPATGVAVYDSVPYEGGQGWFQVGGTSLGAPSWSAILASADQLRAAAGEPRLAAADGSAAHAIYSLTRGLARITFGPPNGSCPAECWPGPGYDFITGLGSPRAGIDQALAATP